MMKLVINITTGSPSSWDGMGGSLADILRYLAAEVEDCAPEDMGCIALRDPDGAHIGEARLYSEIGG